MPEEKATENRMQIGPTQKDADALLAFLPFVDQLDHDFQSGSGGGQKSEDGTLTMPYPTYEQKALDFFRLSGQPFWMDTKYNPEQTAKMLDDFLHADEAERAKTEIADLRMITYCVRGERFNDGHWGEMLSSGTITALLKQLAEIRRP